MTKKFTERDFYAMHIMYEEFGVSTFDILNQFKMCTHIFREIRHRFDWQRPEDHHVNSMKRKQSLIKLQAASGIKAKPVPKPLTEYEIKRIKQAAAQKSLKDAETIRNCGAPLPRIR